MWVRWGNRHPHVGLWRKVAQVGGAAGTALGGTRETWGHRVSHQALAWDVGRVERYKNPM